MLNKTPKELPAVAVTQSYISNNYLSQVESMRRLHQVHCIYGSTKGIDLLMRISDHYPCLRLTLEDVCYGCKQHTQSDLTHMQNNGTLTATVSPTQQCTVQCNKKLSYRWQTARHV